MSCDRAVESSGRTRRVVEILLRAYKSYQYQRNELHVGDQDRAVGLPLSPPAIGEK